MRKKKLAVRILLGLAAIIVVFALVVATRPAAFTITRSGTINAPAATVYDQVNDFHDWHAWSPYDALDPAMVRTITGPPSGVGAQYQWKGNSKAGEGHMSITQSQRPDVIHIDLVFEKPFQSHNQTEFTFKQSGQTTLVTWAMSGNKNFAAKAFCMFVDMDKMVGGDFEKGLANLKKVAEARAVAKPRNV